MLFRALGLAPTLFLTIVISRIMKRFNDATYQAVGKLRAISQSPENWMTGEF